MEYKEKTSLEDYLFPPSELDVVLTTALGKGRRNFRYPFAHKWLISPFNERFQDKKYVKWRNEVIKQYNGECQRCGGSSANQCHHIKNYSHNPKLRYEPTNGILFCKDCHKSFHLMFGTRNNNKKQVELFLKRYQRIGDVL